MTGAVTDWDGRLEEASTAWITWCRAVESAGIDALTKTITRDEIDLAEGLRHLARMARLTLFSATENRSTSNPYFWPAFGPAPQNGRRQPAGSVFFGAGQWNRYLPDQRYGAVRRSGSPASSAARPRASRRD